MQADRPVNRPQPPPAETGLLAEIAAGLATSSDLKQLVTHFLDRIVLLAGAQAGTVRLLSDAGDQLQLVSTLGLPEDLCGVGAAVDRHCGHCGAAADGQQIVWATDLRTCSDRTGSDYFGHGGRCLLAVPLQHRGRTLGVYNLFFSGTEEPSPEIQAILRSIGELLGLALNNARLEQRDACSSHAGARAPDDGRRGARFAGAVAGLREDAHAAAATMPCSRTTTRAPSSTATTCGAR